MINITEGIKPPVLLSNILEARYKFNHANVFKKKSNNNNEKKQKNSFLIFFEPSSTKKSRRRQRTCYHGNPEFAAVTFYRRNCKRRKLHFPFCFFSAICQVFWSVFVLCENTFVEVFLLRVFSPEGSIYWLAWRGVFSLNI